MVVPEKFNLLLNKRPQSSLRRNDSGLHPNNIQERKSGLGGFFRKMQQLNKDIMDDYSHNHQQIYGGLDSMKGSEAQIRDREGLEAEWF